MRGTVKFFNAQKGWGFITDSEGKDIFVHHTSIVMDGFRHLDEGDVVNFNIGTGNNGRKQAVNVIPILTMKMVKNALKKEKLHIMIDPNACDDRKYVVADRKNVIQSSEQGMSLVELAVYAGLMLAD